MKTAPKGREFYFCDGTVAKSVGKLIAHIKKLSPEKFAHHVNEVNNDFYNWINECISKDIAKDILGNKTQKEIIEKLTGHHWEHRHKRKHKTKKKK